MVEPNSPSRSRRPGVGADSVARLLAVGVVVWLLAACGGSADPDSVGSTPTADSIDSDRPAVVDTDTTGATTTTNVTPASEEAPSQTSTTTPSPEVSTTEAAESEGGATGTDVTETPPDVDGAVTSEGETSTPPLPSSETTSASGPEEESNVRFTPADDLLDYDMLDVHTGATVNLRSVADGKKPLLFWFWSPL